MQDAKNQKFDEVEETRRLNHEAVWGVCRDFGIRLSSDSANLNAWRATARSSGSITGMPWQLTILLTDGCVAWFQKWHDGGLFFGHIKDFDGKVEPLFPLPKEGKTKNRDSDPATVKKPKISKPKPNPLQAAKDLLESILSL